MFQNSIRRLLSVALAFALLTGAFASKLSVAYAATGYADVEIARAVELGFGTYREDNPTVTYAEFMHMLDRTVALSDSTKLDEWQSKLTKARVSNQTMTRFDGMMAVLNCADTLGGDYPEFNVSFETLHRKIGDPWDEINNISGLFSVIPLRDPYNGGGFQRNPELYQWGDDVACYRFAMGCVSTFSGKTLFDYDAERNSMRPADQMTYTEALLVALRLHDKFYNGIGTPLAEVGTHTIPKEYYTGETNLPDASNEKLPAWRGMGVSHFGWPWMEDIYEAEYELFHALGFNFVRIGINFSLLSAAFDPQYVYEDLLLELDKSIGWAFQNDIHVQLMMNTLPGHSVYGSYEASGLFDNPDVAQQMADWWAMIARRYADIPNRYLSINIANEVTASSDKEYLNVFEPAIDAIWVASPGRVIVADIYNQGISGESMARKGVALSRHQYSIAALDFPDVEQYVEIYPEYIRELIWPMPYLPDHLNTNKKIKAKDRALKIDGDFSGGGLSVGVCFADETTVLNVKADGKVLLSEQVRQESDVFIDVWGAYKINREYSVDLPDGTKHVEVYASGSGTLTISRVAIQQTGQKDIILTTVTKSESWSMPQTTIRIEADGRPSGTRMVDWAFLKSFDPYNRPTYDKTKAIAKKYGVGFMVNEIGPFGTYLPEEVMLGYMETMLEGILSEGVGYAICESQQFSGVGNISLLSEEYLLDPNTEYVALEGTPYFINVPLAKLYARINGIDWLPSR